MKEGAYIFEFGSEERFDVCLFLEDEAREERDDLLGLVSGERVLKDELRQNELIRRVDLPRPSE